MVVVVCNWFWFGVWNNFVFKLFRAQRFFRFNFKTQNILSKEKPILDSKKGYFLYRILSNVFLTALFHTVNVFFSQSFVFNQKYTVVHINCLLTQYLLILTFIILSNVYLYLERLK